MTSPEAWTTRSPSLPARANPPSGLFSERLQTFNGSSGVFVGAELGPGRASRQSLNLRRRVPGHFLIPRPQGPRDVPVLIAPEIGRRAAGRLDDHDFLRVRLIRRAEAARAFGDQHAGGEWVE